MAKLETCLAAIMLIISLVFVPPPAAAETIFGLSAEKLFSLSADSPEGYQRRLIRAGGTGFDFTTALPRNVHVSEREPTGPGLVSVVIETMERVDISIRHLPAKTYVDARAAALAYMRLAYDEVVLDEDAGLPGPRLSNPAFTLAAGVRKLDDGRFTRMARAAFISRGDHAAAIVAEFDPADHDRLQTLLSHIFGGIRMENELSAGASLRRIELEDGGSIVIPQGWAVSSLDLGDKTSPGLRLTLGGSGYPELTAARLDIGMAEARVRADALMDDFTERLGTDRNVELSERGERIMTEDGASGPALYLLSRRWRVVDKDMPMISFIRIMRGHDGRIWQLGETSPDQKLLHRRQDGDFNAQIYQWSVSAQSAAGIISRSIYLGPDAAIAGHSVRAARR